MSITILQSGDNNAYKAAIDSDGRLTTKSFQESFEEKSVFQGDAYNLNTGDITIGAAASGVSYLKNTDPNVTLIVKSFIYLLGNSGVSGEDGLVTIIENPTSGTLLSGSAGTPKNRNAGLQQKTLNVDWRIGSAGATVTGGSTLIDSRLATPIGRSVVAVPVAVPPGSSLAIKYTPQSSNTSQICQFAFAIYRDTFN
jgi:hypothetical protein